MLVSAFIFHTQLSVFSASGIVVRQQIDLSRMDIVFLKKRDGFLHVLFVSVYLFDGRNPDIDSGAVLRKADQIFKYQFIVNSDVLLMKLRIHNLHIIKECIYIRKNLLKSFIRSISACVDGKRYSLTVQL